LFHIPQEVVDLLKVVK